MVSDISIQNTANQYGSIAKLGTTTDNRVIYQISNANGEVANKLTVAQKDCDIFEKSFQTIIEVSPKIQKYQEDMTPRQEEIKKNRAKTVKWMLPLAGFLIPAIFVKPKSIKKDALKNFIQITSTIVGTAIGFIGGQVLGAKVTFPPGGIKLTKAMNTISKLDIKPYE